VLRLALTCALIAVASLCAGSATPVSRDPAVPTEGGAHRARRETPSRYASIVPKTSLERPVFRDLVYEGHNVGLRGERDSGGMYADGVTVARRWRHVARGGRRLFALRDGLSAQQDHPTDQQWYALMMPASWVTAALANRAAGRPIVAVAAPPLDDEAAWRAPRTARELFGSFPPSRHLFRLATAPADGKDAARTRNARRALQSLAADAAAMIAAVPHGAAAVAMAGAERIARSDRRYFGASIRRDHIILVAVENPTRDELLLEAKSPYDRERADTPAEIVAQARDAVYRRRLADGDIALERYDLSRAEERRRAIAVLEALVPRDRPSTGGVVWVWIVGPAGPRGPWFVPSADAIAGFRREIAAANVDTARVRLLPRPGLKLPDGPARKMVFEESVDRFRTLDLPLGLVLDSRELAALIAPPALRMHD